jgi:hypothetical protein
VGHPPISNTLSPLAVGSALVGAGIGVYVSQTQLQAQAQQAWAQYDAACAQ